MAAILVVGKRGGRAAVAKLDGFGSEAELRPLKELAGSVAALRKTHPDLIITGHSLGGSYAAIVSHLSTKRAVSGAAQLIDDVPPSPPPVVAFSPGGTG